MNYIIIIIAISFLTIFIFVVGYLIGFSLGYKYLKNNLEDFETETVLYCFECEIEMPVKEKNGRFYCANCGLYH